MRALLAMCSLALVSACAPPSAPPVVRDPPRTVLGETLIAGPEGRLFVDDGGGGPGVPVVFIHSFGGNADHWAAELTRLRPSRRAAAFDVRGHGRSDPPRSQDGYAVERMADDLAAVVAAMRVGRVALVGHSMGGPIALAYARREPLRVAGIMLVGPPGRTPPDQAGAIMANLGADYSGGTRRYLDHLLTGAAPATHAKITREFVAFPQRDGLAVIRELFVFDPLPALDVYRGPILLVLTDQNDQPADLHRLRPELPRRTIVGTSHWPHLDRPAAFDAVLDDFLAAADRY